MKRANHSFITFLIAALTTSPISSAHGDISTNDSLQSHSVPPGYQLVEIPGEISPNGECMTSPASAYGSGLRVKRIGETASISLMPANEEGGRARTVVHAVPIVARSKRCGIVVQAVETDAIRIRTALRNGRYLVQLHGPSSSAGGLGADEVETRALSGTVAYCLGQGCVPAEVVIPK